MNLVELVSQYKYLQSLLVLVSFFLVSKLIVYISERFLIRLTKKTRTDVDDLIIERTNRPISLILFLLGIKLAVVPLGLDEKISLIVSRIVFSFITIVATYTIILVIDILIDSWGKKWAKKTKSTVDDQLINLLHRFSSILFYIFGFIYILDIWGVQVGPYLASLGIAGIAIAFALQNSLANIFGGISLIIDKSIRVGDVIELDQDTKGTVLDVGLRSTRIRTFNNEVIVVPNGKLADAKIWNYAQPDLTARAVIPFSVSYGSDVDKVKKLVLKQINKIKDVMKEPKPLVRFIEMGDSGLHFKAYFWVEHYSKRFPAIDKANTLIYNALNKAGIEIPFPQMDVHLKKQ